MPTTTEQIALLNDKFRKHCMMPLFFTSDPVPGMMVRTRGVAALPPETQVEIMALVRDFHDFDGDNDPHGEHDFGACEHNGQRIFWKIDYYSDRFCHWGAEHPEDPAQCFRVLTIMLASEY
jgi:hypothetical protein